MPSKVSNETNHNNLLLEKNVDLDEITKFDAIAFRWWDINSEFKSLHRINPLRLEYIMERTNGLFDKNVLDVGCGGGILTESMSREGAKVTGLDMSAKSLVIAQLHALESSMNLDYRHETVETHAEAYPETYDVVTCMEMLEHVPDPASVVNACARLVKPGGEVFFSTLNRNLKTWLMVIVGAEYILRMVPSGTHHINKFIKPAELINWVNNNMLREKHIIGLQYNPINDCFCLSSNIDVNYIIHTQR